MKESTTPFTIRISESVKTALESIAEKEDRSVNYVVNRILREYLRNHESTKDN